LIIAIFAWAKDRVPISSIGFGIGEKLADAKHVPLVRSGQIYPLSIHLCIKNIETSCHIIMRRVITDTFYTYLI
jgi:hypothetical protein